MPGRLGIFALLIASLSVVGCAQINVPLPTPSPASDTPSELFLQVTDFEELPGWDGEDHAASLPTFLRSCKRLRTRAPGLEMGIDRRMGTIGHWLEICDDAARIRPGNAVEAKYFYESRMVPYIVGDGGDTIGLFTGYYEPEIDGRWGPEPGFDIPIYSRPKDIVSIDLGSYRDEFAGTQLAGRLEGVKMVPYYDRAAINTGALRGRGLEILWVNDAIDKFFMQVQGSGRVLLPDGSHVRLGYAGRNGHRYTSIGRELVGMGQMRLEDVTAPAIRQWLRTNPVAGTEVMNRNRSYVFFRVIEGDGPIGAQGVPLTAGRSLAIDDAFLPYGIPLWLETTDPLADDAPLRRIMVTQDTGSAITGPVRGDVFWGFGDEAGLRAGLMKQEGRYFILLPRVAMSPDPTS